MRCECGDINWCDECFMLGPVQRQVSFPQQAIKETIVTVTPELLSDLRGRLRHWRTVYPSEILALISEIERLRAAEVMCCDGCEGYHQ